MIIQLPLENWADLLPFVPRQQLVEIVKRLGDRQFARILQFFLTQVGQITLGHLRIVAPRENGLNGCPVVELRREMPAFRTEWQPLSPSDLEKNLPEGPMPTNIRDFKLIELSYFDMSVANFLHQFQEQENSLLDNVNLWFSSSTISPYHDIHLLPILAQLMSMIGYINSVYMWTLNFYEFGCGDLLGNNQFTQMMTTILTKTRILDINGDMSMFPFCEWLCTPRNDGQPRVLYIPESFPSANNFIERIKKDFSNSKATDSVSFFVYIHVSGTGTAYWQWQDRSLDNAQTNERLTIKTENRPAPVDPFQNGLFDVRKMVLISRYSMEATQEWVEANEQQVKE